jgi:hypothetical protein
MTRTGSRRAGTRRLVAMVRVVTTPERGLFDLSEPAA